MQTNHYKQLQETLLREKAAQLGVNTDELMIKVINGKQVWVKKTEVYSQLEKQRNLITSTKQVPRALRGEDSLINRITGEIKLCIELLNRFRGDHIINALESTDHQSILNTINERSKNLATQLGDIEKNIETIKEGDSTFALAEALLYDMNKAHQSGDQHAVKEMKGNHGRLLKQYEVRRKKLLPFVHSARQLRLEIQKDYWRVLNMRWKLINIGVQYYMNRLNEMVKTKSGEEQSDIYLIKGHDCRTLLHHINQVQSDLFGKVPDKSNDTHAASLIYDNIIPNYVDLLNTLDNYLSDLARITLVNLSEINSRQSPARMAFVDKK